MGGLNENEAQDLLTGEVETGDGLIFAIFLVHQSGENGTNELRWRCHFRNNDLD